MDRRETIWCMISIFLWVLILVKADYTHFTWWSITSVATYASLGVINAETRLYWFALSIQLNVIAGVITMSIVKCTLLCKTHADIGDAVYIIGNFLVHFLPFILIVWLRQGDELQHLREETAKGGILSGYVLFLMYNGVMDAVSVYGCGFNHAYVILGAAMLTAVLFLEEVYTIVDVSGSVKRHKLTL